MENEDDSIFTLTSEDGEEYNFRLLDYVDYEDKLYVVLAPEEADIENDEELELAVMEVTVENDVPSFSIVESDDLANEILNKFIESSLEESDGETDGEQNE